MTVTLDDLAGVPIWLIWEAVPGQRADGSPKIDKPPIDPRTGYKGSKTDPAIRMTRSAAEAAAHKYGLVGDRGGIGLLMLPFELDGMLWQLCGLDTDHCYDEGEKRHARWADAVFDILDGHYAETSPSGSGRHHLFVIEADRIPDGVGKDTDYSLGTGRERHGFELYTRAGAYLTFTGRDVHGDLQAISPFTLMQVFNALEAFKPRARKPKANGHFAQADHDKALNILAHLPNAGHYDDYPKWVGVIASLHAATSGSEAGRRAAVTWSKDGGSRTAKEGVDVLYEYFDRIPPRADLGHLVNEARDHGYEPYPRQRTRTDYAPLPNDEAEPEGGEAKANAAEPPNPNGNDTAAADLPGDGDGRGPKQADILIDIASKAKLFHTPDGTGFADLEVNGHRETWPIQRKDFRRWLMRRFYEETGGAPNSEALQSARGVIQSKAQFDADALEREVYIRIGEHGGKLYLDLGDTAWRAVEIAATGWQIIDKPPLRFRRASGMKPLPDPQQGGSIEKLRDLLNVAPGNDFVLVVAWLLAALRGRGPYPVLALSGEQGTGKSLFVAMLRSLVDPNIAALRSLPREERDLFIAATNGHVLAFDNVSGMPAWLSDALCRVATGAAFAARQLYSDQDEVLLDACRPVILNGIEDIVGRSDLADRTLFQTLPLIAEEKRRTEAELWSAFETERPLILGALLDAVAEGLKRLPQTRLEKLPRMADFALWVSACEPALWETGTFMKAYAENIGGAVDAVIDADPVADAIRTMMTEKREQEGVKQPEWEGTASALLPLLAEQAGERIAKSKSWPESGRALSGRLRRAATGLRKIGIEIDFKRKGQAGNRTIRITGTPKSPGPDGVGNFASVPSAPSAAMPKSKPANDLAAQNTLTQTPALTQTPSAQNFASAQKPFENRHADATDGTDANPPTPSGPRVERRL